CGDTASIDEGSHDGQYLTHLSVQPGEAAATPEQCSTERCICARKPVLNREAPSASVRSSTMIAKQEHSGLQRHQEPMDAPTTQSISAPIPKQGAKSKRHQSLVQGTQLPIGLQHWRIPNRVVVASLR